MADADTPWRCLMIADSTLDSFAGLLANDPGEPAVEPLASDLAGPARLCIDLDPP